MRRARVLHNTYQDAIYDHFVLSKAEAALDHHRRSLQRPEAIVSLESLLKRTLFRNGGI